MFCRSVTQIYDPVVSDDGQGNLDTMLKPRDVELNAQNTTTPVTSKGPEM